MKKIAKLSFFMLIAAVLGCPTNAMEFKCPALDDMKALINNKLGRVSSAPYFVYNKALRPINTAGFTSGYSIDVPPQILLRLKNTPANTLDPSSDLKDLKDVSRIAYMAPNPKDRQPWHMFMCSYPIGDESSEANSNTSDECTFVVTLLQNEYTSCTLNGEDVETINSQTQISSCKDLNCALECTPQIPTRTSLSQQQEYPRASTRGTGAPPSHPSHQRMMGTY